jgi:hypothetical protein
MSDRLIPPAEIPEPKFWAALKPLLDLLGTTPFHQYDEPGLSIALSRDPDTLRMHVRFKAVVEDPAAESPWPIVATGDGPHDELAYDVDVVVVPEPGVDLVAELWPGPYPKGTPANESGV